MHERILSGILARCPEQGRFRTDTSVLLELLDILADSELPPELLPRVIERLRTARDQCRLAGDALVNQTYDEVLLNLGSRLPPPEDPDDPKVAAKRHGLRIAAQGK